VTGDLTIRGVTRPVTLDGQLEGTAKDPWGNQRAATTFTGKFDRKDFGLTWNMPLEGGGVLVSDQVKLEAEITLVQKVTAPAAS
jgi:polyisoprenoid-binding protein YceI